MDEILEKVLFEGYKDPEYRIRKERSDEMLLHSNGSLALHCALLGKVFPSEPEYIRDYRLDNIARVTKTYFNKVIATLAKIERADDFIVNFTDKQFEKFTLENVYEFDGVINWFFRVGIKVMLEEPNGFFLIMPTYNEEDGRLVSVRFFVLKADTIVYLEEGVRLIVKIEDNVFWDITNTGIIEYEGDGVPASKKFTTTTLIEYELEKPPVIKFGGQMYSTNGTTIYESFIAGVVPFWNQALIEYSDKQGGVKQHMFPEKWRYLSGTCPQCNGNGSIGIIGLGNKEVQMKCTTCDGTGNPPTGPYGEILIQAGSALDKDIPKPPVGYVQKDFSAIEYLDADFKANIYYGLAAINMEFLVDRPPNQSGISKEMDRQEINSFIYQVARHITNSILTPAFRLIAEWFYYGQNINIEDVIPAIKTPVHFDYISTDSYEKTLQTAKTAGFSSSIIQALEKRYIQKQFENFFEESNYLLLINKLDPLPAYSIEQKKTMFETGVITYEDFICSVNIEQLISTITYDRVKFYNFDYGKQKEILTDYTRKLIERIEKDNPNYKEVSEEPEETEDSEENEIELNEPLTINNNANPQT